MVWQIISAIGVVCTIIFAFLAFRRETKKIDNAAGTQTGTMLTEIGYIKGGVDDIKRQQEKQAERHLEVVTRLTKVEESAKSAHHRIDNLEKGKNND